MDIIEELTADADVDGIAAYSRFVTYRLSQLNAKLSAQASRLLRVHSDLSVVQWRILALISASAPVTSAFLVKAVAIDAGLFSRNLKSLISSGLILSRTDSNDQRQQVLRMSKRGMETFKRAAPVMKQRRESLTQGISPKELDAFFSILERIEKNASRLS